MNTPLFPTKYERSRLVILILVAAALFLLAMTCLAPSWAGWLFLAVPVSLALIGGFVVGILVYDWIERGGEDLEHERRSRRIR